MRFAISIAATFVLGVFASAAYAATVTVTQDDPEWFGCCGPAQITSTNPRSGNGSVELSGNGAWIGYYGVPFGIYSDLESVSFEWYIASFTSPDPFSVPLPVQIALRAYEFGDSRTFFLTWDTCSFTACDARPLGAWQSTQLARGELVLQEADGNPLPESIPDDAPITEIHLRAGWAFGGQWLGFTDNVSIAFTGQDATTYTMEAAPVPEPGTWMLLLTGLALVVAVRARRVPR